MGLDGLGAKMTGTDELGKRLRKKKRARVASPQPDSRSQNSVTVSNCLKGCLAYNEVVCGCGVCRTVRWSVSVASMHSLKHASPAVR